MEPFKITDIKEEMIELGKKLYAENTFDQYWYLAGKLPTGKNSSFWPHIGLTHSWKFNEDPDLAAGFFYVYKQYSFYLWGNDFFKEHPRLTFAIDFTF